MDHQPAARPARADLLTARHQWPEPARLGAAIATDARRRGGLLVCSDFDGTLAPIASTPDGARAVPAAQPALDWLSREGAAAGCDGSVPVQLAVVTSRDVDDLMRRLRLGPAAVAVGCSGLERWVDGRLEVHPDAVPFLPALEETAEHLAATLDETVPGARLERKRCGVVIHTRGLPASADARALALARSVARERGLTVVAGKRAAEIRPPVDVDKADAVRTLRAGPFAHAALCVAGDDLPDVEMLTLATTVSGGTAVAVADIETPATVLAAADVAVEGPWAWAQTLRALVNALRSPANR